MRRDREGLADARNRHLQEMPTRMEMMIRELDALDADLDSQLHDMLEPLPYEPGAETAAETATAEGDGGKIESGD